MRAAPGRPGCASLDDSGERRRRSRSTYCSGMQSATWLLSIVSSICSCKPATDAAASHAAERPLRSGPCACPFCAMPLASSPDCCSPRGCPYALPLPPCRGPVERCMQSRTLTIRRRRTPAASHRRRGTYRRLRLASGGSSRDGAGKSVDAVMPTRQSGIDRPHAVPSAGNERRDLKHVTIRDTGARGPTPNRPVRLLTPLCRYAGGSATGHWSR